MSQHSKVEFSVVIPILNEEKTIEELCRRLEAVIRGVGSQWEVIFVNDGSSDRSLEILLSLQRNYSYLKVVDLSRNFGHQQALTAGLHRSSGKAVILMDGDLQDPPEALPLFIEKWKCGFEVVYAVRAKRKEFILKRIAFWAFYRIQAKVSRIESPLHAGIFSLMDRRVVSELRRMPERNRYLAGLRAYAGFRQIGIEVERGARFEGDPRVSVFGLFRLAQDAIFSFSTLPLRLLFWGGSLLAVASFVVTLVSLYYRFVLHEVLWSWAFGLSTLFFFAGVQLISLGIIGEYVGRIYDEVKQRPYFIESDTYGFHDDEGGR